MYGFKWYSKDEECEACLKGSDLQGSCPNYSG